MIWFEASRLNLLWKNKFNKSGGDRGKEEINQCKTGDQFIPFDVFCAI